MNIGCSPKAAAVGSPDGGIGRRAGLKHQWSNPCRFDPGSGYRTEDSHSEGPLFFFSNDAFPIADMRVKGR